MKKMKDNEAVKKALKVRDMSQKALATAVGYVGQSAIGQALSRENGMRVDLLVKFMSALGYDVVIKDRISGKELCTITNGEEAE